MVNKKLIWVGAIIGAIALFARPKTEEQPILSGDGGGSWLGSGSTDFSSAGGVSSPTSPPIVNVEPPSNDFFNSGSSEGQTQSQFDYGFDAQGNITAVFNRDTGIGVLVDAQGNPIGSTSTDVFTRGGGRLTSSAGGAGSGGRNTVNSQSQATPQSQARLDIARRGVLALNNPQTLRTTASATGSGLNRFFSGVARRTRGRGIFGL